MTSTRRARASTVFICRGEEKKEDGVTCHVLCEESPPGRFTDTLTSKKSKVILIKKIEMKSILYYKYLYFLPRPQSRGTVIPAILIFVCEH